MKPFVFSFVLFIIAIITTAFEFPIKMPQQTVDHKKLGDSLSIQAQQTLISNLLEAIQKGGVAYAVEFCNEKAMPLTEVLSAKYDVEIQRISAKNRNPKNMASLFDKKILGLFSTDLKDTLLSVSQGYVYYKPIKMGMPTCLQCHGQIDKDIEPATLRSIRKKYRFDKATGYKMGELRGAWKLTFSTKK